MLRNLLIAMRPRHWAKNILVFFPLIFGQAVLDHHLLHASLLAFIAFCLASSSIYLMNDISDIEFDRSHPVKKNRPIASEKLPVRTAWIAAVVLLIVALGIAALVEPWFFAILIGYVVLMIAYNKQFKFYALIDVGIIATGFLLRIIAGGVVTGIALSKWLILMTFLLSLFLALGKRRNESGEDHKTLGRSFIKGYKRSFVDMALSLFGGVVIVAYILYTISPEVTDRIGSDYVFITSFPVMLGVLRYLQLLVEREVQVDPIEILYADRITQILVVLWGGTFAWMLYF